MARSPKPKAQPDEVQTGLPNAVVANAGVPDTGKREPVVEVNPKTGTTIRTY